MEEETNNSELLINTPQVTEQPTTPQPTTETNPEPTETQNQEEPTMHEDLSKLSLEELQAEIERRKQGKATPQFELNENNQSNLAKFLQQDKILPLTTILNAYAMDRAIAKYPGKLTKFAYLKDEDRKPTTDKEKVHYIHIVSVDGEYVVDKTVSRTSDKFSVILEKI